VYFFAYDKPIIFEKKKKILTGGTKKRMIIEARMSRGVVIKNVIDSIKDLVTEDNLDFRSEGICLQAMDASHVSLVTVLLGADAFDSYTCDRNASLGIHFANLGKILKCASQDDAITIRG
jgi:proliferating cell nuclear antigen